MNLSPCGFHRPGALSTRQLCSFSMERLGTEAPGKTKKAKAGFHANEAMVS